MVLPETSLFELGFRSLSKSLSFKVYVSIRKYCNPDIDTDFYKISKTFQNESTHQITIQKINLSSN